MFYELRVVLCIYQVHVEMRILLSVSEPIYMQHWKMIMIITSGGGDDDGGGGCSDDNNDRDMW